MTNAAVATSCIAFVLNVVMSKSLQDIFALLNAQNILTHMMLLASSATAPSNIYWYNDKISVFVQSDMYPTDEIYGEVFNFTESESPIEQFEDLGYEGANYMLLTGSLLINLIMLTMVAIQQKTCLYCAKKFSKNQRMR